MGQIQAVESCLPAAVVIKGEPPECHPLLSRMAELHVPGVSIAVVHNGRFDWVRGYGVKQLGGEPITPDTLFQAGSISKSITAMAVLHLVQEHKLSLDSDVNALLTSWKIPPSTAAPGATVTLRELLTHTAGMTVHGFAGYAANTPVPTLLQVLNGEPPANSAPIRIESVPGEKWKYSGGGYTVIQQLLIDVSKEPFAKLLHDTVLAPIQMTHSTFDQPLPAALRPSIATPYATGGVPVAGGPHTYPELAAAGLWTTPSDLARYIIEVQQSLEGHANHVLSQSMTQQMLTPGKGSWGLGVQIGGSTSDQYFSHGGVDEGYESLFVAYEHNGDGAVVMTNAEGGSQIAAEVMRSIAVAYDWSDFRPVVRSEIKLDANALARYVGTYQIAPNFSFTFTLEGDRLMLQATKGPKLPIFPESTTKFFLKAIDAEIEFFPDDEGQVSYLVLHQNGQEMKAIKK